MMMMIFIGTLFCNLHRDAKITSRHARAYTHTHTERARICAHTSVKADEEEGDRGGEREREEREERERTRERRRGERGTGDSGVVSLPYTEVHVIFARSSGGHDFCIFLILYR